MAVRNMSKLDLALLLSPARMPQGLMLRTVKIPGTSNTLNTSIKDTRSNTRSINNDHRLINSP
jgi:hypothetical protein